MSYTLTATRISPSNFQKELDDAGLVNNGVIYSEDILTVLGDFDASEEIQIDALVPACQLACARMEKIDEVVNNTRDLINAGFDYSSVTFPLILDSRSNYIGIQVFASFPYKVQNIDKSDVVIISDQAAYNLFVAAGMTRYLYIKDGEADLILEVKNADTIEKVDAIEDDRV